MSDANPAASGSQEGDLSRRASSAASNDQPRSPRGSVDSNVVCPSLSFPVPPPVSEYSHYDFLEMKGLLDD